MNRLEKSKYKFRIIEIFEYRALVIRFNSENEANQALMKLQHMFGSHFEGNKIKVKKILESIKEKPNDSDNNGSSSGNNDNSGSKSSDEEKKEIEKVF